MSSLATLVVIAASLAGSPSRNNNEPVGLDAVGRMTVVRTSSDALDVVLDMRGARTTPPCTRLDKKRVRVDVSAGRIRALDVGGAAWKFMVSGGLPLPLPQRMCEPATLRIRDVAPGAVQLRLRDDVSGQDWLVELEVPPFPACSWSEPSDGRIVPGQRVRISCGAATDVAALAPFVFFRVDERAGFGRPTLEMQGGEIAFVVPGDWSAPSSSKPQVRVYFMGTKPKVTRSTTPIFVDSMNDTSFHTFRDLDVKVR